MSPKIEREPAEELDSVWDYLSDDEAEELRLALQERAAETKSAGWHMHLGGPPGPEVTIAAGDPETPSAGQHQ